MIKFFRKIRYDLMESKKIRRYLKYSIGEIVLVVIGILIALQVNNWNEERKDAVREMEYLENLRSEMRRNRNQIIFQIEIHKRQLANGRYILSVMDGNITPDSSLQLALALQEVPWFTPVNITRDVWTELIATGNIGLLREGKIKDKVAEFYSRIDYYLELERECQTYYLGFRQSVAPLLNASDWVVLTEYLQNNEGEIMDVNLSAAYLREGKGLEIELPKLDNLRNGLASKNELNGLLSDLIACRELGRRTFEAYRMEIDSILESLNIAGS